MSVGERDPRIALDTVADPGFEQVGAQFRQFPVSQDEVGFGDRRLVRALPQKDKVLPAPLCAEEDPVVRADQRLGVPEPAARCQ